MPATQDHLAQAQHNKGLLALLWKGSSTYPDWVVTVTFYVAVHLVEAYFDRKYSVHSPSHTERSRDFTSMVELKPIYGDYSELYNLSMESRYRCHPSKWIPSRVQKVLGLLTHIEQHLGSLP